jgi:hypothetical protein
MKKTMGLILTLSLCFALRMDVTASGIVASPEGGTYNIQFDDPTSDSGMATIRIFPENGYELDTVFVDYSILGTQERFYRAELYPDSPIRILFRPAGTALPVTAGDVSKNDWYYDHVAFCMRNGLFKGVTETEFAPGATLTRAMVVTVLHRMTGEIKVGNALGADIPENAWYANAVRWAIATGVTELGTDGLFYPNRAITREELAVMIARVTGNTGSAISEYGLENVSPWARQAVGILSFIGIMSYERPKDPATRAEAAAIFTRSMLLLNFQ